MQILRFSIIFYNLLAVSHLLPTKSSLGSFLGFLLVNHMNHHVKRHGFIPCLMAAAVCQTQDPDLRPSDSKLCQGGAWGMSFSFEVAGRDMVTWWVKTTGYLKKSTLVKGCRRKK